ncbi:cyclic nucleotide-binding domain-containing protein [Halofilum ochraceum]|uniref:cyclic nucleotide-binding domain-containing protein n=1 Tax=Halofilum ochraceum TaxID=1611323 RepID=UPI0008DA4E20|nr:cyclic nucleotide-binding domain-containing protein [Halofilum ochraceum]
MAESTAIARPQRWDRPFGPDMTDLDVERVLEQPLFRDIDASQFPASLPLREIVRNDARVRRYARGDVIVREGDYGNSMFVIIDGRVQVVTDGTDDAELGRRIRKRPRTLLQALRQLWANADQPEVRDVAGYFQRLNDLDLRGEADDARIQLRDVDAFIDRHETVALDEGTAFGEIAALARSSRTATAVAESDVDVVELRWQGLRDIRRRDAGFRDHIDGLYRERSLAQHLREAPLFAHLDDDVLDEIARHTAFESHGTGEWFRDFKRVKGEADPTPTTVLEQEPVIAEQGHYLDGLIMIRFGFARISERLDHGQRTTGYAGQSDVFGLAEIAHCWREGGEPSFARSLRAIGTVDILRVPTYLVEQYVLPNVPARLLPDPPAADVTPAGLEQCTDLGLPQSLVDFFVDERTINGRATMLIDTDRCTACDECVRACAEAHNNNPRFKRHGPIHDGVQVTNACMHCADPVCLIGCPTGAIHRHESGPVVIDDATCIGCGTCANACPYDNISMVEIRDADGEFIVDDQSGQPIMKATKCDLCHDQLGGPACERACPHDALIRIDMHDHFRLAEWVNRK